MRSMLGGKHHVGNGNRPIILVAHRDLGLAVGPQPVQFARGPHFGMPQHQAMRQVDRRRHEGGRFPAGVAEHHSLVAGAQRLALARVHTPADIGRLLPDGVQDAAGRAVEAQFRVVVADVPDQPPHQRLEIHPGRCGDLAGHQHETGLDQHLGRHARVAVPRQDGVEHGIGNLVRQLVGMAVGNRLGSKKRGLGHALNHRH